MVPVFAANKTPESIIFKLPAISENRMINKVKRSHNI